MPRVTPRSRRVLAAALGVVAATAVLSGCSKPVPQVTIQSGATTTLVSPLRYCFDTAMTKCRSDVTPQTVRARSSSSLFVDVPKEVADKHWIVSAYKVDNAGAKSPLDGYGSASLLHSQHSTRVAVPYGTGSYFLSVAELDGTAQVGTWTVEVQVSG
jgi:hypothetical protein